MGDKMEQTKKKDEKPSSYKSYYEKNKEEILRKRRERYARNQTERLTNELVQILTDHE